MESLPRSSETAEQRPISERTRSQRRRSVETNEQTAARLSAQRDRDRQRRKSVDYLEVALTDIDSASCETFTSHNCGTITAHNGRAGTARIILAFHFHFCLCHL